MNALSFLYQDNNILVSLVAILSGVTLFVLYLPKKNIFISIAEAIDTANKEKIIWIDTRSIELFKKGHIVQAKNILLSEIETKISLISNGDTLILISSTGQEIKTSLITLLNSRGYKKVFIMEGGMRAWIESGFPIIKKN